MKILLIKGSPHIEGSSNMLAEQFMEGAKAAGHDVRVFDAAHANLHPCNGCEVCGMSGNCVQHDDMEKAKQSILDSDMMVDGICHARLLFWDVSPVKNVH